MLVATELLKKTARVRRESLINMFIEDWGQPREEETIAGTDAKEEITETSETETESTEAVTDERQSAGKDEERFEIESWWKSACKW